MQNVVLISVMTNDRSFERMRRVKNQIIDYEGILFYFILVLGIGLFLSGLPGMNFADEQSVLYRFVEEQQSSLTFNVLGTMGLFFGGCIMFRTLSSPNPEHRSSRLLFFYPVNGALTLGATGSASIFSVGYSAFLSGSDVWWGFVLMSFVLLGYLFGLAWVANQIADELLSQKYRVLLGGAICSTSPVIILGQAAATVAASS